MSVQDIEPNLTSYISATCEFAKCKRGEKELSIAESILFRDSHVAASTLETAEDRKSFSPPSIVHPLAVRRRIAEQ